MSDGKKPLPVPTSITRTFWQRAREDVLVLPFCLDCGTYTYYPRSICAQCMSRNLEWRVAAGRGTVYSFDIVRSPAHGFEDDVPYVIASIDLAEGVRMMANVLTDDVESVRIGMPVKVVFVELSPELRLPQVAAATD